MACSLHVMGWLQESPGRILAAHCRYKAAVQGRLTSGGHGLQSDGVRTACLHLPDVDGPGGPPNGLVDALAVLGGHLQLLLLWHYQGALGNDGLHASAIISARFSPESGYCAFATSQPMFGSRKANTEHNLTIAAGIVYHKGSFTFSKAKHTPLLWCYGTDDAARKHLSG